MALLVHGWLELKEYKEAGRLQVAYLKSLDDMHQQISCAQDFLRGWIQMDCSKEAQKLQANILRIFQTDDDCTRATEALADTWRQLGHEADARRLQRGKQAVQRDTDSAIELLRTKTAPRDQHPSPITLLI